MNYKIAVIPGDGIGPDIIKQAVSVLDEVGKKHNHKFDYQYLLAGGCAIDETGAPLPEETLNACKNSDAVLLGAVGGPKWDNLPGNLRPEQALLGLRGGLELFANLRPVDLFSQLADASPLKKELVKEGLSILIVRELTGGIYFGKRGRNADNTEAYDTEIYSTAEIERLLRVGFDAAMRRKKEAVIVDKANILESSRLWREVTECVAKEYPEVKYSYMYVDNAAMQLVRNPSQFDVIITSNMFGDILSDEASMIAGSIGMLSSASLGSGQIGMYEPIHGSAPDIAGEDKANPIATILSAALMLKYSFNLSKEAEAIENAVKAVLDAGYRTVDIMQPGMKCVGTAQMGKLICENL